MVSIERSRKLIVSRAQTWPEAASVIRDWKGASKGVLAASARTAFRFGFASAGSQLAGAV